MSSSPAWQENDFTSDDAAVEPGHASARCESSRRFAIDARGRKKRRLTKCGRWALHLKEDCEKCHKPLLAAGLESL